MRALALVAGLFLSASCRDDDGDAGMGAACEDARACATGLCVDTSDARICTVECIDDDACPDGMTCQRFSLAEEGDAGPIGEAVRVCAPATDAGP